MSALGSKLRLLEGGIVSFRCVGCNDNHVVKIGGDGAWQFNGDGDRPTFLPSVLVRWPKMTAKGRADYAAWCADGYPKRETKAFETTEAICHSFVTDGRIQFLADCTHELAGQTVDLPDLSDSDD